MHSRYRFFLAFFIAFCGCATRQYSIEESQRLLSVYNTPLSGQESAKLEVIQYSAFTCTHCKVATEAIHELMAENPTLIKLRFKPVAFTDDVIGRQAGKAVLAASLQGKFWEMSGLLFEHQANLTEALYPQLAAQLGLNLEQFQTDYALPYLDRAVELNAQQAISLGVRGTPAFFIGEYRMDGFKSKKEFLRVVNAIAAGKDPFPAQKGKGKKKK